MLEKILNYVNEKYGTLPEYLWEKFPDTFALRNSDTKKWYAVGMNVKRKVLDGTDGEAMILDLKCEPSFKDLLISSKNGFFPAYHMNKEHWIAVILDGSVSESEIYPIIDEAYALVSKKNQN